MAEPENMVVPMLREIRKEMNERFDGVDQRLDRLESNQKDFRNAMTTDTMMSKFMLGDYEERLQKLETDVAELKKRQ